MPTNFDSKGFRDALAALPVAQQRRVASRFIEKVLDLADERCLDNFVKLSRQTEISAQDLEANHRMVHSIYMDTHPRSELAELDFAHQAKHFVAEACMTSVSPVFEGTKACHLAQQVAMYCRMARTCASIGHEGEIPDFSRAEETVAKTIAEQYAVLQAFLDEQML